MLLENVKVNVFVSFNILKITQEGYYIQFKIYEKYYSQRITTYNLIDPCDGTPCSGKGTCSIDTDDAIDGHSCACNAGYSGNICETSKPYLLF